MSTSFIAVYDRNFDDIYRYVYFRVGNRWDADDITSTVFCRAYEQYPRLRGEARPWLFAIARNAVTDHYRRGGREIPKDQLPEQADQDTAEIGMVRAAEKDCLAEALQALTKEQRELIGLRYIASLQHREIAVMLEISEPAVKMRLHRLLEQLKEMIDQCLTS